MIDNINGNNLMENDMVINHKASVTSDLEECLPSLEMEASKVRKVIFTDKGPVTGAPYSQAIALRDLLFVSGQGPVDQKTGKIVCRGFREQVRLTLENLRTILEAGGSSMENVLKVTVFLADMDDFEAMNEIYREYFKEDKPARTCIQAGRLPFDTKVEIEAVAYIPQKVEEKR